MTFYEMQKLMEAAPMVPGVRPSARVAPQGGQAFGGQSNASASNVGQPDPYEFASRLTKLYMQMAQIDPSKRLPQGPESKVIGSINASVQDPRVLSRWVQEIQKAGGEKEWLQTKVQNWTGMPIRDMGRRALHNLQRDTPPPTDHVGNAKKAINTLNKAIQSDPRLSQEAGGLVKQLAQILAKYGQQAA